MNTSNWMRKDTAYLPTFKMLTRITPNTASFYAVFDFITEKKRKPHNDIGLKYWNISYLQFKRISFWPNLWKKKLFPKKKLSDCNGTQTHNHFVLKQTLKRTRTTLNTDTFYAVLTASFTDLVKLFFTIF